jgi:hypothetical protein
MFLPLLLLTSFFLFKVKAVERSQTLFLPTGLNGQQKWLQGVRLETAITLVCFVCPPEENCEDQIYQRTVRIQMKSNSWHSLWSKDGLWMLREISLTNEHSFNKDYAQQYFECRDYFVEELQNGQKVYFGYVSVSEKLGRKLSSTPMFKLRMLFDNSGLMVEPKIFRPVTSLRVGNKLSVEEVTTLTISRDTTNIRYNIEPEPAPDSLTNYGLQRVAPRTLALSVVQHLQNLECVEQLKSSYDRGLMEHPQYAYCVNKVTTALRALEQYQWILDISLLKAPEAFRRVFLQIKLFYHALERNDLSQYFSLPSYIEKIWSKIGNRPSSSSKEEPVNEQTGRFWPYVEEFFRHLFGSGGNSAPHGSAPGANPSSSTSNSDHEPFGDDSDDLPTIETIAQAYDVLGLPDGAPMTRVRQERNRMALLYHPGACLITLKTFLLIFVSLL